MAPLQNGSVDDEVSLLEAAAVLGVECDPAVLAALTGRTPLDVLDDLARSPDVVEAGDPRRIRFRSLDLHQAHYRALPPSQRAHLHARAARALARAADPAALQVHIDAAGAALDEAELGGLLVSLGEARLHGGDLAGAREAFRAAVPPARAAGDAAALAGAALGLGAGSVGFEVPLVDRAQIDLLDEALACNADPTLRAALTARKSIALSIVAEPSARVELARQALRDAPDPSTRGAALAALCDARAEPGHRAERHQMAGEIVHLARACGDSRLELLGRRHRLVAAAEAGDFVEVDEQVRDYAALSGVLADPVFTWYVPLWRAMRALMEGRTDDSRRLVAAAAELGARAGSGNAHLLTLTLQWCLAGETDDHAGLVAVAAEIDAVDELWAIVVRAHVAAQVGDRAATGRLLDALAPRLPLLARDSEWLPTLAQLAETLARHGGHSCAPWVYDALAPYADLWAVEGIGAAVRGSVELFLALSARAAGDEAVALRHFERAEERHRAVGAPGLVDRTRAWRTGTPAGAGPGRRGGFVRDGDTWRLDLDGSTAVVRHAKGLLDIAALLARPGRPVPAIELVSPGAVREGGLGPALDGVATRAYRRRLAELDARLVDADREGDAGLSARVEEERAALVAELAHSYGLGGRPRPQGDPVERARSTVTARIRDSIRRIEAVHPELGRHLALAIRTGTTCVYEPEHPVTWRLTS